LYQQLVRPEPLFGHIFADLEGYLVTFVGKQARMEDPDARQNELVHIDQRSWPYPRRGQSAANFLVSQAQDSRDAYFGVHLFRESGNRRRTNAVPTVQCLWLDEDEGTYPEDGPEPTAIVQSSSERRHLYWRLTEPVSAEWATEMNRRLAVWTKGDTGKAALASVLRVPGTANYKRHPRVDLVAGWLTGAGPWEPEVLDQAVPEIQTPPVPNSRAKTEPYDGPEMDVDEFLASPDVEVLGELSDGLGKKYAIICPWVDEHTDGGRTGTRIGQRRGGGLWFHCDHDHCQGRTWEEFRREVRRNSPTFINITRPGYTGDAWEVRIHRG
jgi:hypothetical protein